jgi:hypothetical protein
MVVNEWYRYYSKIQKLPQLKTFKKPDNMKFEDFAILETILTYGLDGCYKIIEIDQHKGMYDRYAARRKKRKVKALLDYYNLIVNDTSLIEELDRKVKERYEGALQ